MFAGDGYQSEMISVYHLSPVGVIIVNSNVH